MALLGPFTTRAQADAVCAGSGSGTGDADCCMGAGDELEAHPGLTIAIPAGALSGNYSASWQADQSRYAADFSVGDVNYTLRLACAGGAWVLTLLVDGVVTHTGYATDVSCSPFGLVFAGTDFGTTGDITVDIT